MNKTDFKRGFMDEDEFTLVVLGAESVAKHGNHDQSSHGRRGGRAMPSATSSPAQAADAIAAGQKATIAAADLHDVLDKLADREELSDLTKLHVEGSDHLFDGENLGIPRSDMPQVPSGRKAEFVDAMDKAGIRVVRERVAPDALKPIQAEISGRQSGGIMRSIERDGMPDEDKARMIISNDGYVLDGHHRWAAASALSLRDSSVTVPVFRVDLPRDEAIQALREWNDVTGIKPIALGERNPQSVFKYFDPAPGIYFAKSRWFVVNGQQEWEFDSINAARAAYRVVAKHGSHDQSSHGRRGAGGSLPKPNDGGMSDQEMMDAVSKFDYRTGLGAESAAVALFTETAKKAGMDGLPEVTDLAPDDFDIERTFSDKFNEASRNIEAFNTGTEPYIAPNGKFGMGTYFAPKGVDTSGYGGGWFTRGVVKAKFKPSARVFDPDNNPEHAKILAAAKTRAKTVTDKLLARDGLSRSGTLPKRVDQLDKNFTNAILMGQGFDAARFSIEGVREVVVYNRGALQVPRQGNGVFTREGLPVTKHGTHDQSSHGRRTGTAGVSTRTTESLADRIGTQGGFTYDIKHGRHITTGYMVSDAGAETPIDAKEFFSDKTKAVGMLKDYIRTHIDKLLSPGAYFGAWHDTESGRVVLDVSRRYPTKAKAWKALQDNNQDAFFDLATGTTHYKEENPNVGKARQTFVGRTGESDGSGHRQVGRGDGRHPVRKQSVEDFNPLLSETLTAHVSNGRTLGIQPGETVIAKHGDHDQSSHGRRGAASGGAGKFGAHSVESAREGAVGYSKAYGIQRDESIDYETVVANRARAAAIADVYDTLPDHDPAAEPAFRQLATEVDQQFDYMTKTLGITVEFTDADPYPDSKSMFAEVSTGKLRVLRTASTGGHPFFTDEQNDKFRAVHDFFGHAATGRGFGQDGEEAAWVHHSQMFTPLARQAMTTETRGQNSWFNTRKNGFAKQKVALLPAEYWQVPSTFEKRVTVELIRLV